MTVFKLRFSTIMLMLTSFAVLSAQEVKNVLAKQEGKQVVISYDITGSKTTDKFEVKLYYAQGSNEWREAAKGLSGDIGSNITGGTGKEIRWKPLDEFSKLTGSSYRFKVVVSYKSAAAPYGIADNMIYIEGGTYTMGCTSEQGTDCSRDEKPSHSVTLKGFNLSKYEVTQAQWQVLMGSNPSAFLGCENCPIENVSSNDVQEFVIKLNNLTGLQFRLPTEAEWEYAARGGNKSKGYKYSGSNDVTSVAWYTSNSDSTHVVGQKQPNELGLYDMSGNVWEWCSDWYSENYYYSSPSQNPSGSGSGTFRVVRGGSWNFNSLDCRVAFRSWIAPNRYFFVGFRLAQDL